MIVWAGLVAVSCISGAVVWARRRLAAVRAQIASVDEDYPDLHQFDRPGARRLVFPSAPLCEAVARMGLLSDTVSGRIVVRVDGDKALLSTVEADVGSLADVVPCAGDFDQEIKFHPRYFRELIEAAAVDELTFELDDPRKPALVRSEGLLQVLMPSGL